MALYNEIIDYICIKEYTSTIGTTSLSGMSSVKSFPPRVIHTYKKGDIHKGERIEPLDYVHSGQLLIMKDYSGGGIHNAKAKTVIYYPEASNHFISLVEYRDKKIKSMLSI